jgi:hypothetical protein
VQLYTNEYNIYADGDKWANYYAGNIEAIRSAGIAAGYGDVVGGIGTQYYVNTAAPDFGDPNLAGASNSVHNPARMMQTIQNLSAQGLPITLTEFGVKSGASQTTAAQMLGDSLRMAFGSPNMNGFFMWGFQAENTGSNLFAPAAALYTVNTSNWANWTITDAGKTWQDMLGIQDWDGNPNNGWTTPDQSVTVDSSGRVTLSGFYGNYNIGNQSASSNLNFAKNTVGAANLTAPPTWSLWNPSNSGSWNSAGNWSTGGIASGAGQTAYFGPASSARTIGSDAAHTVGMLAFDSANPYRIGGAGTITLQGFNNASAQAAAIYVAAGSHQINSAVSIIDDTTITVAPASSLLLAQLQPTAANLTKNGAGSVTINALHASNVTLSAGTMQLSPGGTSVVSALNIAGVFDAWNATLDVTNTSLTINYTGASPLATMQNQIKNGASNNWTGSGITSTHAAAIAADSSQPHKTALGLADTGSSVLILYTLQGDATLDGHVNALDFNALASNFGAIGSTWVAGDFNYDGVVTTADFDAMAINFNAALPGAAVGSLVPEPSAVAMLSILPFFARKRRHAPTKCTSVDFFFDNLKP